MHHFHLGQAIGERKPGQTAASIAKAKELGEKILDAIVDNQPQDDPLGSQPKPPEHLPGA
jgi:hypothetical protein